jgi:hypothetical protein
MHAANTANLEARAAAVAVADKTKPAESKRMDVGTVAATGLVKVASFGSLAANGRAVNAR